MLEENHLTRTILLRESETIMKLTGPRVYRTLATNPPTIDPLAKRSGGQRCATSYTTLVYQRATILAVTIRSETGRFEQAAKTAEQALALTPPGNELAARSRWDRFREPDISEVAGQGCFRVGAGDDELVRRSRAQ